MSLTTEAMPAPTERARAIRDRGIDAELERRPGVPMETLPHPVVGAHWREPDRQEPTATVLKRREIDRLTPVFGTAQPPRGASGLVRRLAYRIPEHRARRWMLLLVADRVDVLEHRLGRAAPWIALALPIAAVGIAAARRARR